MSESKQCVSETTKEVASRSGPNDDVHYVTLLNPKDVLLGRGQHIKHEGIRKFREIVQERAVEYTTCRNKAAKATIARDIARSVKELGGRFVRSTAVETQVPGDRIKHDWKYGDHVGQEKWVLADENTVLDKIKQTFRDYAVVARKASAAGKPDPLMARTTRPDSKAPPTSDGSQDPKAEASTNYLKVTDRSHEHLALSLSNDEQRQLLGSHSMGYPQLSSAVTDVQPVPPNISVTQIQRMLHDLQQHQRQQEVLSLLSSPPSNPLSGIEAVSLPGRMPLPNIQQQTFHNESHFQLAGMNPPPPVLQQPLDINQIRSMVLAAGSSSLGLGSLTLNWPLSIQAPEDQLLADLLLLRQPTQPAQPTQSAYYPQNIVSAAWSGGTTEDPAQTNSLEPQHTPFAENIHTRTLPPKNEFSPNESSRGWGGTASGIVCFVLHCFDTSSSLWKRTRGKQQKVNYYWHLSLITHELETHSRTPKIIIRASLQRGRYLVVGSMIKDTFAMTSLRQRVVPWSIVLTLKRDKRHPHPRHSILSHWQIS